MDGRTVRGNQKEQIFGIGTSADLYKGRYGAKYLDKT